MANADITMSQDAIHNPNEPRHFMRLKPAGRDVRIRVGDAIVAETTDAIRLLEVGRDFYDPVLYVPENAMRGQLRQHPDLTTHCPLKGDAIYFDLVASDGTVSEAKIAWSYAEPFDFAATLSGLIAFDPKRVVIEEAPLP
ncbi:MAG: DUF427 domain-containing protein [Pseudomonadota bacterium]